MDSFALLTDAIARLRACDTVEELAVSFADLVLQFGMTASACGMLTGPRGLSDSPIHFRTWDPAWLKLYDKSQFLAIDPLVRYPIVSGEAGSWSEIYAQFPLTDAGHKVLEAANRFGYREGYVTPVRTRDGSIGLVSIGGSKRRTFSIAERTYVEAISTAALRRAEEFPHAARSIELPGKLSMRERECVALLRLGLTDGDIAGVLGISPATVRGHVDQARAKLGVRNRTQLATIALL